MFDDQQQSGSPVPGNLPVGEPEDMFAGTDPAPAPSQAAEPQELPPVQESASAAPSSLPPTSALGAGALRPAGQTTPPSPPPAPPTNVHVPPVSEELQPQVVKGPSSAKFIMTIVLVLVGIGLLGGIGYMAYRLFVGPTDQAPLPTTFTDQTTSEQTVPETQDVQTSEQSSTATDASTIVDDAVLFGEPIDNDSDNLDNAREEVLGTDLDNWDTDGDGLGDGDEVIIWKTDPQNPDTDGDGFEDGSEVRNGYSPTGPGRIFEPPTPGQETTAGISTDTNDGTVKDNSGGVVTTKDNKDPSVCESDAECFIVAASSCDASSFMSVATFDLRQTYGVLQDVTYEFILNGEASNGSCNLDMSIKNIDLAFTDGVTEEQKQAQRDASAVREGKTMNCEIASDALISAINMRNEVDILTRVRQTGSCLGPLAEESA